MRTSISQVVKSEYLVAIYILINTLFQILSVLWFLGRWPQAPCCSALTWCCHLQRSDLCGGRDGLKEGPEKHGETVPGHKQVEDGAGQSEISLWLDFCNGYSKASQTPGDQIKL